MITHRVCLCSRAALDFVSVPGCSLAAQCAARQMGEPLSNLVWPVGL